MTGYDETIQRTKADIWKRYWEERGYEVVNPYDLGDMLKASYENRVKREPTYAEYLHEDLINMEWCTDIFFCCGWENSNGCMAEADKAIKIGLKPHFETKIQIG